MKHLSIRFKLTFWFTLALILVAIVAYAIVFTISDRLLQKGIRDMLIETVTQNLSKIEFCTGLETDSGTGHYIPYADGFLEFADGFSDSHAQIYTALYREDGSLLYGENPISRQSASLAFLDAQVQPLQINGTRYYIFDRRLSGDPLNRLWLRGVVSEEQSRLQLSTLERLSLALLPLLVFLASIGGYLLAGRLLRPIQSISHTARRISQGSDLKQRIDPGKGNDELHQLAQSFNEMFARLEQSFEAERRFASDASHELQTPMSVISAQCEYTLETPRTQAEYEESLQVIQRQSQKMSQIIRNLLEFTRLQRGTSHYAVEAVDLSGLVASVCSDMALLREKGIQLNWETVENARCAGNPALLARLLTNLISNAYRYGQENGHILVRLQRQAAAYCLSVTDDGIGIAPQDQANIFRRFYQADPSHSPAGAGLGLSMAQEIAHFHNTEIRVESELGKGSAFSIIFPSAEEKPGF